MEALLKTPNTAKRPSPQKEANIEADSQLENMAPRYHDKKEACLKVVSETTDIQDGISAQELFSGDTGISYRDYLVMPGYIDFHPSEILLETQLCRGISLKQPIVSSPMDTVTESKMSIALALLGGIGIIHYNNTLKEQVRLVEKVKRYKNGFITDPITLSPQHTLADIDKIKQTYGFSGIPITQDGTQNSRLVGLITNRDIDLEKDRSIPIQKLMTTQLVTAQELNGKEGKVMPDLNTANQLLKESKKGKLPIVNEKGQMVALICRSDLQKNQNFPMASKDASKRLRVGAAISTQLEAYDRIPELVQVGVDCFVIDSAQGYSHYELELLRWLKKNYPEVPVIAGNVVTVEQCRSLIDAGCDALRIGMGPGSICIMNV